MRALSVGFLVMCLGCGGAEFTGIDARASRPELDAGAIATEDGGPVDDRTDAGERLEGAAAPEAAALDALDPAVDAGVDARELEASSELDAAEDHHLVMTCTASDCPACPMLEQRCCNTQTITCGCYATGLGCH
jgi:hypothetical protein